MDDTFTSHDSNFCVSWLLGLVPTQFVPSASSAPASISYDSDCGFAWDACPSPIGNSSDTSCNNDSDEGKANDSIDTAATSVVQDDSRSTCDEAPTGSATEEHDAQIKGPMVDLETASTATSTVNISGESKKATHSDTSNDTNDVEPTVPDETSKPENNKDRIDGAGEFKENEAVTHNGTIEQSIPEDEGGEAQAQSDEDSPSTNPTGSDEAKGDNKGDGEGGKDVNGEKEEDTQEHGNEENRNEEKDQDDGGNEGDGIQEKDEKDEENEDDGSEDNESEDDEDEEDERNEDARDFLEICDGLMPLIEEAMEAGDSTSRQAKTSDFKGTSPSRDAWLKQTYWDAKKYQSVTDLMNRPGLEPAKEFMLKMMAELQARKETGRKTAHVPGESLHIALLGNPGTGKSMTAKHFADAIAAVMESPEGVHETSGVRIAVPELQDNINSKVALYGHCVVIIHDADEMTGHPRDVWAIHNAIKDKPVVIIMTGSDAAGNMINSWPGIAATYNTIRTQNYTSDELLQMLGNWLQTADRPIHIEGGLDGSFARLFAARISRMCESNSFTNAWALREALNEVSHRFTLRLSQARARGQKVNDRYLTRRDLLGEYKPLDPETCPAWKELLEMTGLDAVKNSIRALAYQMEENDIRQALGKKPILVSPNKVFLGNPGTGKTTVAKLYAKILKHLGLLSNGELLLRNASDLIDRYIGGSENNTKEILAAARGNVLVIDDAYVLNPGCRPSGDSDANFRAGVLDTLVSEVPNAPGEDRCIILAGYRDQMISMFQNANPGLQRRFPIEDAFLFEDYTVPQLEHIFDLKVKKDDLKYEPLAKQVAMEVLERARDRPHFANGAEVDNLLSKAKMARNRRAAAIKSARPKADATRRGAKAANGNSPKDDDLPLVARDIDPNYDRAAHAAKNCAALFSDMVGFDPIVQQFRTYQRIAAGMRAKGIDPRPHIPFTFVFRGPPGTGKTTTARRIGQVFYDMGFLASDEVIECTASDMVAEYCGQTGPKVNRLLERALGKVLFIDEAYRLCDSSRGGGGGGGFESQAIGELVDAVTKPQFARRMIIILAGYDTDMTRMLASNAGLRSRFATDVIFPALGPEQCLLHLGRSLRKAHVALEPVEQMELRDRENVLACFARAAKDKGWASGRSVQILASGVISAVFGHEDTERYALDESGMAMVRGEHLVEIMTALVPPVEVQIGYGDRKVWR